MENQTETVEDLKIEETGATVEVAETVEDKAQKIADAIVAKKLAKMPTKEELAEFKAYKDSLKTETEKQNEVNQEMTKTKNENMTLKQENALLKKGISAEDMEFVQFKISKMDGDFDENLEEFLEKNPKYLSKEEKATVVEKTTGVKTSGVENKESGVSAILRAKRPDLFNN